MEPSDDPPQTGEISLREFLHKPELRGVQPGLSRSAAHAILGEPENYAAGHAVEHSPIWKYSGVELHFDPTSDRILMLFADDPETISALGAGLAHGMARSRAEAELARCGYTWIRTESELLEGASALVLASGVRLLFDTSFDEENGVPRLHGVVYRGPHES